MSFWCTVFHQISCETLLSRLVSYKRFMEVTVTPACCIGSQLDGILRDTFHRLSVTLSGVVDLELGEVREDLGHGRPG